MINIRKNLVEFDIEVDLYIKWLDNDLDVAYLTANKK